MGQNVKIFFLIVIILFMNSEIKASQSENYMTYVNEIRETLIKEMDQKLGLRCTGDGGALLHDVELISVRFSSNKKVTVEEAREIEVAVIERLLQLVNNHKKIRPFLREYPFPYSRTSVMISFDEPGVYRRTDGSVVLVGQGCNRIYYCSGIKPEKKHGETLSDLYGEPYVEALKIVHNKYNSVKFTPCQTYFNEILHDYAKEMKLNFELFLAGDSGCKPDEIEDISVKLYFFDYEAFIDNARRLEVIATEGLLKLINSNEKIRPYLKNYPLTIDKVKADIIFQNWLYHYPIDDKMAYVTKQNGAIQYYIAKDEKGDLVHLCDESYDTAAKIVHKTSYDAADKLYQEELENKIEALRNSFGPYAWHRIYFMRMEKEFIEAGKELGLKMSNSYWSGKGSVIDKISVHFESDEKVDLGQARQLEVAATERVLKIINNYKKIRQYLISYPFKIEQTWITITFHNQNDEKITDNRISSVGKEKGMIYYNNAADIGEKNIYEESYDEAVKIVQKPQGDI